MADVGPTANLPGTTRRSGRAGKVYENGRLQGEIVSIEWTVEVEQVAVTIAGSYRDEVKPGGETRRGTLRVQDVHDKWLLRVWRFLDARRRNDRAGAQSPYFDITTVLDDIGAPAATRWLLIGCQLFQYDGGHSQEDDLITRDIPFTFRDDKPLDAFEYADNGTVVMTRS